MSHIQSYLQEFNSISLRIIWKYIWHAVAILEQICGIWYEIGVGSQPLLCVYNKNVLLCTQSYSNTIISGLAYWPKACGYDETENNRKNAEQFRALFFCLENANIEAHTHIQYKLTLDVCKSIKCSLTCRDHYSACNARYKSRVRPFINSFI